MEMYIIWVIGWIIITIWISWLILGYPIYSLLKSEKIELKRKKIELEITKLLDSEKS